MPDYFGIPHLLISVYLSTQCVYFKVNQTFLKKHLTRPYCGGMIRGEVNEMTKKERKARTLHREELLVKYQLVSDFARQLSIFQEKSSSLFYENVGEQVFKKAVSDMNDLKDRILAGENT